MLWNGLCNAFTHVVPLEPYYLPERQAKGGLPKEDTIFVDYTVAVTEPNSPNGGLQGGCNTDIGFLKMYFSERYIDYSNIPQSSPFIGQRGEAILKKTKMGQWGSRLIPFVNRQNC